jgi:hypothetical protein
VLEDDPDTVTASSTPKSQLGTLVRPPSVLETAVNSMVRNFGIKEEDIPTISQLRDESISQEELVTALERLVNYIWANAADYAETQEVAMEPFKVKWNMFE